MQNREFHFKLCHCFDDCQTFCHAWACQPCRDADTYKSVSVTTYWSLIGIMFFFSSLGVVIGEIVRFCMPEDAHDLGITMHFSNHTAVLVPLAIKGLRAIYLARLRQQLRVKLGGSGNKAAMDCLCYWCCPCCVVNQNARQVDGIQHVSVQCCCSLVRLGQNVSVQQLPCPPVGQVVTLQQPVETKVV